MNSERDTKKEIVKKKSMSKKGNTKGNVMNFLIKVRDFIVKYFKICLKASIKFLRRYKYLIMLDIIIFVLTVFIESLFMYKVGKMVWVLATLLFISVPSVVMTLLNKVKKDEIIISLPIFYVFFLIFLDFCTIRDLYGITSSTGSLDKIPNFIDAIFVVFVFTAIEYICVKVTSLFKRKKK